MLYLTRGGSTTVCSMAEEQGPGAAGKQVPAIRRPHEPGAAAMEVTLTVNGKAARLYLEPRVTLLDALRGALELTGAKKACEMGNCGACTVLVDGRAVYSCLALAVDCDQRPVTTIEGLGAEGTLDPLQQAFLDADAFQCGYCTPGQIMSLRALFDRHPQPSDEQIAEAVSGNLCRCGAYANILRAARMAAGRS
jgi:xanthine dehydrogenase YagT iron-sulfur-binding subunit